MTHESGIEAACVQLSNLCYANLENQALAAIQAYLSASGMVLVPREPTPKMVQVVSANWGRRTWEEFGNVLQAAPDPFKSKP